MKALKEKNVKEGKCWWWDSNPHGQCPLRPERSASTSSATSAIIANIRLFRWPSSLKVLRGARHFSRTFQAMDRKTGSFSVVGWEILFKVQCSRFNVRGSKVRAFVVCGCSLIGWLVDWGIGFKVQEFKGLWFVVARWLGERLFK